MDQDLLRWPDLIVIGLNFTAMIAIGVHTARKSKSSGCLFPGRSANAGLGSRVFSVWPRSSVP